MGRRALRARGAVASLAAAVFFMPTTAAADSRSADVRSSQEGFRIEFARSHNGADGDRSGPETSACAWSTMRYSDSQTNVPADRFGERPSTDHDLWMVFCDGVYFGTYWLGPSDFGAPPVQPIVDRLVRQVLIDGIRVKTRPDGEAITGIPSLFWVEGYDGRPITATEEAFGLTVTVTAQLRQVEWDFGDGTPPVRAGLGEAWPERSSVRHSYRYETEPGRPYKVTASLILDTSFSVNGDPATALPSITRLGELEVHVDEVQAVRNR